MTLPMNPQSVIWPAAPGEAELELARPYQHAHSPSRYEDRPPSGIVAIRIRYKKGELTFETATEKLHRSFGMSWTFAGTFLLNQERETIEP